jgi:hypothetical protein
MRHAVAIALAPFVLAATAAHALPSEGRASVRAGDPRDRVTCRRFLRTGSLVDSYRTCKTNREWQREHENIQHLSVSDSCGMRGEDASMCNP